MPKTWTEALEDELRSTIFEGQVRLEDLLVDDECDTPNDSAT